MFKSASIFDKPIGNWDVRQCSEFSEMFFNAGLFDQNISGWQIRQSASMDQMFQGSAISQENKATKQRNHMRRMTRQDRERQINAMKANQLKHIQQIKEQEQPEDGQFDTCSICMDVLNNVDGPDTDDKCIANCKDVVVVCKHGHQFHRGCILNACNPPEVNVTAQMGINAYNHNVSQRRKGHCPLCATDLLVPCDEFRTVPKVETASLAKIGGKKSKYSRKANKAKTKKRVRKSNVKKLWKKSKKSKK